MKHFSNRVEQSKERNALPLKMATGLFFATLLTGYPFLVQASEKVWPSNEIYSASLFRTMCLTAYNDMDSFETAWKEGGFGDHKPEGKLQDDLKTDKPIKFYYETFLKKDWHITFSANIDVETNVLTYCGLSLGGLNDFDQTVVEVVKLLDLRDPIYGPETIDMFSVIHDENGRAYPRSSAEVRWNLGEGGLTDVLGSVEFYTGLTIGKLFLQIEPNTGS